MAARYAVTGAGVALIGVGFAGLLANASSTHPIGWFVWFAGAAVAHDALLAPLVVGVAYALGRLPGDVRRPLRTALVLAGSVTAVALPMVLGYGRRADNPSVLPQAYGAYLAVLIGLMCAAVSIVNAYSRPMGRAILTVVGVLLAIWLLFTVLGMIIAALKFLIWLGLLAVIAAVVVTVLSRLAKSR